MIWAHFVTIEQGGEGAKAMLYPRVKWGKPSRRKVGSTLHNEGAATG